MVRAREIALAGFGLLLVSSTSSLAQVGRMCVPALPNPEVYTDCRVILTAAGEMCQCIPRAAASPFSRGDQGARGVASGPASTGSIGGGSSGPAPVGSGGGSPSPTPVGGDGGTVVDGGGTVTAAMGNPGNERVGQGGQEVGRAGEKSVADGFHEVPGNQSNAEPETQGKGN